MACEGASRGLRVGPARGEWQAARGERRARQNPLEERLFFKSSGTIPTRKRVFHQNEWGRTHSFFIKAMNRVGR